MGEFLIDIAQEEADMWHQKYQLHVHLASAVH